MKKERLNNLLEQAEYLVWEIEANLNHYLTQLKVAYEEQDSNGVNYWFEAIKETLIEKSEEVKNI